MKEYRVSDFFGCLRAFRLGFVLIGIALLTPRAFADPTPACVSGTLASYVTIGSSGCVDDAKYYPFVRFGTFSDFDYAATGVGIDPNSVTITPLMGVSYPPVQSFGGCASPGNGCMLSLILSPLLRVENGQSASFAFSYHFVNGENLWLFQAEALTTGSGSVTLNTSLCLDGIFNPTCTGKLVTGADLIYLGIPSDTLHPHIAANSADVRVTLTASADPGATLTVDSFRTSVMVPEPDSLLLLGVALLPVMAVTRRKHTRRTRVNAQRVGTSTCDVTGRAGILSIRRH